MAGDRQDYAECELECACRECREDDYSPRERRWQAYACGCELCMGKVQVL